MSDAARDPILAALLDGPFRRLRDHNHIDPLRIQVWDLQEKPVIPPRQLDHSGTRYSYLMPAT